MRLKFGIALLLSLAVLLSLGASALDSTSAGDGEKCRLIDDASLLSESESEDISKSLDEMSEEKDFDFVIATTANTDGKSSAEYADDLFDYGGFGMGEDGEDGMLLLIDMDNREIWISTRGSGLYIYPDREIDRITDDIWEYVSDGEYYTAFLAFMSSAESVTDEPYYSGDASQVTDIDISGIGGASSAEPRGYFETFTVSWRIIMPLVVGFLIALITVSVMKGQLKSVKRGTNASNYVRSDSFRLDSSTDRFLYSSITKVPRAQSEPGGRGGHSNGSHGSFHGGGTHVSSSGHTHGGGGRHF